MSAVEYVSKDARFGELFKGSVIDYNNMFVEEMLKSYKGFEGLNSLVDVGGGNVLFSTGLFPRIEQVAGDMFKSVPKGYAIFMKWILHCLDDKQCLELLKNRYEALPVNGKVIVVDLVIPESPDTNLLCKSVFQFDLFMMNTNGSEKERTEREFKSLAKGAEFSHVRVACCAYSFSAVEFDKNM
ncbi:hypothetical protein CRYUN_Cryun19dG0102700 [Craigia yunnanensis]